MNEYMRSGTFYVLAAVVAAGCSAPAEGDTTKVSSASPVVEGGAFDIEPPMASYFAELDAREQREQIRDWAVFGTLVRQGASSEQLAKATFEMPPARLPYTDELYSLEHGRGRRAYLGKRVLLFRDKNDPDPIATIGRLADRVRIENGELPSTGVEVYLVTDDRDTGVIHVSRDKDVSRGDLLGAAYGYVEGFADTQAQLDDWLGKTDDLTFFQIADDGSARLGGRRYARSRTPNVTVDDVAAMYQAHVSLDAPRQAAKKVIDTLSPRARAAAERIAKRFRDGDRDEKAKEATRLDAEIIDGEIGTWSTTKQEALAAAILKYAAPPRAPGFSLDPEWAPDPVRPTRPLMASKLRAFAVDPCRDIDAITAAAPALAKSQSENAQSPQTEEAMTIALYWLIGDKTALCSELRKSVAKEVAAVADAIDKADRPDWDTAFAGYYKLLEKWRKPSKSVSKADAQALAATALSFHEHETRAQCARYEGLEGTRAGATLFYTDLVAKVWAGTDFGRSAPIDQIPGFLSMPRIDLPVSFAKELTSLPATRLWFGPRSGGVTSAGSDAKPTYFFEPRFSRIYAAGNNPTNPGTEQQPAEDARRALGWWDAHFEEIADYEPEYHRQNQLMKWALVTATFLDTKKAGYLQGVSPVKVGTLASWRKATRGLRFVTALPQPPAPFPGKECIPLLASYGFESAGIEERMIGGVTVPGRMASRRVGRIDVSKDVGMRKPVPAHLGEGLAGTATRARQRLVKEQVTFVDAGKIRLRDRRGDVALTPLRVDYSKAAANQKVTFNGAGELRLADNSGTIRLRWTDGAAERLRRKAPAPGTTLADGDRLARDGHVVAAADVYERLSPVPPAAPTAEDLVRDVIVGVARRNPTAVLKSIDQVRARGGTFSPAAREMLLSALSQESAGVAKHVEIALAGTAAKPADGVLGVSRGHVVVTRDFDTIPVSKASLPPTTDLDEAVVYVAATPHVDRTVPDYGGTVADWANKAGIRIEEVRADPSGLVIPDRLVEKSTATTYEAVRRPKSITTSTGASRPRMFLVRQCDADHQTPDTRDDC